MESLIEHNFGYVLIKPYSRQTYECMLFILCPKSVASWEEGVRISCIKPLKVTQVHTEPDLKETYIQYIGDRLLVDFWPKLKLVF